MDGDHRYEIILRQGDLRIELSSDDVYFISKQMDKWFRILLDDKYIPVPLPSREPAFKPAPVAEPARATTAARPAVEIPFPEPVETPVAPAYAQAFPQQVTPVDNTPNGYDHGYEAEPAVSASPAAAAVAFDPYAEPVAPKPPRPGRPPQPAPEAFPDDFEAVMDSLMEDLGGASAPAQAPAAVAAPPRPEPMPVQAAAPAASRSLSNIDSLLDLCEKSRAASPEDYLMLSAYFLTYFEGEDRFSLKRINSLMVKSGLTPINHSVMESALTQNMLAIVPDLTGMAEVTEYQLTATGQRGAEALL